MSGLTLFLGSSDSEKFQPVNGYYWAPRVYTTSGSFKISDWDFTSSTTTFVEGITAAFLDSIDVLDTHFATVPYAPDL
jgi:hypothetical protein